MTKCLLGDVCYIEKGKTPIKKAIPGKYPLVVTSEERSSNNQYQFDSKAICVPLVSSTGHGHASINRLHYQEGKFALGSILAAIISKNEDILNSRYLFSYLSHLKDYLLVPLMRGSANVSLTIKKIQKVPIEIPPINRQIEIMKIVESIDSNSINLRNEINKQFELIEKLRRSVLLDAVSGKLVPQNPNNEPASNLLKKIKTEKKNLKDVLPIKKDELPYELPKGWEWCRLGDISQTISDGVHYAPNYLEKGIPCISAKDVYNHNIHLEKCNYVSREEYNLQKNKFHLRKNSILVTKSGSIGRTAIFDGDYELYLVESIGVINLNEDLINPVYIQYLLDKIFDSITYDGNFVRGLGVKHLTLNLIGSIPVPLPSLKEQNLIVEKVNILMKNIDELEKQVKENQKNAELLMDAVLREVF